LKHNPQIAAPLKRVQLRPECPLVAFWPGGLYIQLSILDSFFSWLPGAVPLISPLTARADFGLVVQPRFQWAGIGPMLAEMGWTISPTALKLPLMKRSERRVPLWVLSFMVLGRLKTLLERMERRFEITTEVRPAPKGRADRTEYATRQMARGNFLAVPCTFSDLRDDRLLRGAIRYVLEKQLGSLETQRNAGAFVHRLIALAESLLVRVRAVPARRPGT